MSIRFPRPRTLILLLASLALFYVACQAPVPPVPPTPPTPLTAPVAPDALKPSSPPVVLRSYEVPEGQKNKITAVLKSLLPVAISPGPGSRIVVVGPEALQQSVATFLEDFKAGAAQETPPTALAFDYWLVMGRAAAETDVSKVRELESALSAIDKREGPMAFRLIEKLSVLSVDGESSEVKGQWVRVRQTASANAGTILSHMELDAPGNTELRTMIQLAPEQLLVLGQVGFDPSLAQRFDPSVLAGDDAQARLYIVVRATVR